MESERCAIRYLTATLLVGQGPESRIYLFSLLIGGLINVYAHLEVKTSSNVVDVVRKWLLKLSEPMAAEENYESEVVRNFC